MIMAIVYLGIGSNLGNRRENIETAVTCLTETGITVLKISTIVETDPVGGPSGQGMFLNGVLKVETRLSPRKLLDRLKSIERQLGRVKTVPNGPRPIDLDILLYDRLELQTPRLTVPHPRMFERDFVMRPLSEIEPQLAAALYKNKIGEPCCPLNDGREELSHARR
jgi:2-amino-4-hydroxy-6-hydroxymethyldihydropteridine diphosphokinase